jgi:2-oxoisovalerate dehydrogenase E1 component
MDDDKLLECVTAIVPRRSGVYEQGCCDLKSSTASGSKPVNVEDFKKLAKLTSNGHTQLIPDEYVKEALLIRVVEQKFLELFEQKRMNGTVHTCVGQEFSAVAIAGQLSEEDWVTSNHRCHGHFISKTKNWGGLIDELMGSETGVCKGIGGSQHLYAKGFLSNGPQGALLPIAVGIAMHKKRNRTKDITASFIGEGTLGVGVLYESLNLASLYELPLLFVCENNLYSQSTPQGVGVSGDIRLRPEAFGINTFEANTWDVVGLLEVAKQAISYVREHCRPAFLLVRTYRLNPHSKGDDNRDQEEVKLFCSADPLNVLLKRDKWRLFSNELKSSIDRYVESTPRKSMLLNDYLRDQLPRGVTQELVPVENDNVRMVHALNQAYRKTLEEGAFHIGEDICDPYGGAFKVTKGLSTDFPDDVINAPISEAGLVGLATGMALFGTVSYAEIMFGDFATNIFDQLLSNISKIHHMYAFQASVPVRIRVPMGGKRGYGPTHSQSLEKFLLGMDNLAVVSLTSLIDPRNTIREMNEFACPAVLVENKVDYGKILWSKPEQFDFLRECKPLGALKIVPRLVIPTVTLVAYGETARELAEHLENFFIETDLVPELIVPILLHPLETSLIEKSVRQTNRLIVIEDGAIRFGFGAEVLSCLIEKGIPIKDVMRIGAEPVPIPSVSSLEAQVLPTINRVIKSVVCAHFGASNDRCYDPATNC